MSNLSDSIKNVLSVIKSNTVSSEIDIVNVVGLTSSDLKSKILELAGSGSGTCVRKVFLVGGV